MTNEKSLSTLPQSKFNFQVRKNPISLSFSHSHTRTHAHFISLCQIFINDIVSPKKGNKKGYIFNVFDSSKAFRISSATLVSLDQLLASFSRVIQEIHVIITLFFKLRKKTSFMNDL